MAGPCAGGQTVPGLRHLTERTLDLLECVPLSIHLLLFRLAIASVFLPAGFLKLASWESTMALFQDEYTVPVLPPILAATLATTFEVGCSGLLIAGLATRLATLPLLGQIVTIQLFVYPQAWHVGRDLTLPADSGSRNCFARPPDQSLAGTARLARGPSVSQAGAHPRRRGRHRAHGPLPSSDDALDPDDWNLVQPEWCTHCINASEPTDPWPPSMDARSIRHAIREAETLGVKEIYFTGREPLLHPEILTLLTDSLAVAPTSVLTIGTRIDVRMAAALARLAGEAAYSLDIRVSLDDADEQRNDRIRGGGA